MSIVVYMSTIVDIFNDGYEEFNPDIAAVFEDDELEKAEKMVVNLKEQGFKHVILSQDLDED